MTAPRPQDQWSPRPAAPLGAPAPSITMDPPHESRNLAVIALIVGVVAVLAILAFAVIFLGMFR